jgi:hypothetical protein
VRGVKAHLVLGIFGDSCGGDVMPGKALAVPTVQEAEWFPGMVGSFEEEKTLLSLPGNSLLFLGCPVCSVGTE